MKQIEVGDISLHQMNRLKNMRGDLFVGDFFKNVPFAPKRYFLLLMFPVKKLKGEILTTNVCNF